VVDRYVMAVDQGTSSTRCILFDHGGRLVAVTQREHKQHFPRPGWVEHDPVEIWHNFERIAPEALAQAGATTDQVVALGLANQRETTVLWDRHTGRPVGRAVVWQDTRTDALVDELSRGAEEQIVRKRCGLPPATYFSAPKVRWLLDRTPGLRQRAERGDVLFGTMESWLIWNLTGGPDGGTHVTDITNASRTLLMDLTTLDWHDELLAIFGVPRQMLPEIRPSIETYGLARRVLPGVRISAALGDQQAALFGQTCFDQGEAKCTYGTGSFLLLNTGHELIRSTHGLLTTVGYKIGDEPAVYALEGSIAITGALVQWFRDGLGLIGTAAEIETLARSVDDNGGCYIVPAFSGLFAPHWRNEARGVIVGLTSYVTKGHLARAVLEATGWQTREVVDAMNADTGLALKTLKVDGGMTADNLLMQFLADVLNIPIMRPMAIETVSLGAAYAAGLAVGYWPDLEVLRRNWHRAAQWLPSMEAERREVEYENWHRAVERTFDWIKPSERLRRTSGRGVDVGGLLAGQSADGRHHLVGGGAAQRGTAHLAVGVGQADGRPEGDVHGARPGQPGPAREGAIGAGDPGRDYRRARLECDPGHTGLPAVQPAVRRPRPLGEDPDEASRTHDLDRRRHGLADRTRIVRRDRYDAGPGQDPAQQGLVDVLDLGQEHDPAVRDDERQQQGIKEGDMVGRDDRAALPRDVLQSGDLGTEQHVQRRAEQDELEEQPEGRRTIHGGVMLGHRSPSAAREQSG
jgi:glycerol kinase